MSKWMFNDDLCIEMMISGVKLSNAYIYAMYEENQVDLDSEIYSVKRLERSFDEGSGP